MQATVMAFQAIIYITGNILPPYLYTLRHTQREQGFISCSVDKEYALFSPFSHSPCE